MCLDGGQLLTVSQLRVRAKEPDEACAQATDLARRAAEEVAGAARVGAHVGIQADGDRVVTHLFSCLDQAYQGWRWAVTLARASWSKTVTVSESVLIPGPDAILAPDWVPWRERLLPGDLGVGDILPAPPDDERLFPGGLLRSEGRGGGRGGGAGRAGGGGGGRGSGAWGTPCPPRRTPSGWSRWPGSKAMTAWPTGVK